MSEKTHALLNIMATSRVRVAGPLTGRKGMLKSKEGERAMAMGYLRRTLSIAIIEAQSLSLLGRLAKARRMQATDLEEQGRVQQHTYIGLVLQNWTKCHLSY